MATDVRSFHGRSRLPDDHPALVAGVDPSHGKPVLLYDVRSPGAQAYAHLAGEMRGASAGWWRRDGGQGGLARPGHEAPACSAARRP
ncbi:MAG: hypothetical protein U1E17_01015 [Geminicoccaceae bacterium]